MYRLQPVLKWLSAFLISYQILSISNRFITPNGDGRNDFVSFSLDNPSDVEITGRIYSLRGEHIADMRQGPKPRTLSWDGRAEGATVPAGIYIYLLVGGDRHQSGTVVVVR